MYSGKVINFKTGNPLAGVPVSDGLNIVLTDEEGKFELPGWECARVINVGILTELHDDWYKYIDNHKGDFDFYVSPVNTGNEFSFLHVSDTEIDRARNISWIDFMRETVKKEKPLFFANTGDLAGDDGLRRHHLLMNSETMGCTVRYAIGNHDMRGDDYAESVYEKRYGPTWYSFDCGEIHFIVLSIGMGDKMSGYKKEDRVKWLEKDLEMRDQSKGVIILTHYIHPNPKGYGHTLAEITEIAGDKGLLACVFGHDHYNYVYETDKFICICSARPGDGGVDSTPAGIRKISISGKNITSKVIYNIPDADGICDENIWSTQLSGNGEYSSPIEVNGNIWIATNYDGYPANCGIYKLCGKTGEILSYYKTCGIKGDIAYDNGRIYAQDMTGVLYCINESTGALIWKVKSDISKTYYTRTGVLIADKLVIAGSPARLHAYNKENGELVWTNNLDCCESAGRLAYDSKRRQVIVPRHWLGLYSVNVDTGEQIWENKTNPYCWYSNSSPVVSGDIIYKTGLGHVAVLNAENGEISKSVSLDLRVDVSGACALSENMLYVPTSAGGVFGLDKDTLEIKLRFPCGYAKLFTAPYLGGSTLQAVEATPAVCGENLIFAAVDGVIYIYNKNTAELKKKIKVGYPIVSKPIVTEDYIIVTDFSGRITSLTLGECRVTAESKT